MIIAFSISKWLTDEFGMSLASQEKWQATLFIFGVLWIARIALLRLVRRADPSLRRQYYWRRASLNVTVGLAILMVGRIWFSSFEALATIVGLASAGLAIALKDPIVDLAGWIFISWRKPFVLGDRIDIGDRSGDVVDIRAFQFSMMEVGNWVDGDARTGRVVHVPNGEIFHKPVANTTGGWFKDVFHEVVVVVTFESDWNKARIVLTEINERIGHPRKAAVEAEVVEHAPDFLVMREELEPQVIIKVVDHGVALTLRYLCEPRARRKTESQMWIEILQAFAKHPEIEFAYPTTRFFGNPSEATPAAPAPAPVASTAPQTPPKRLSEM